MVNMEHLLGTGSSVSNDAGVGGGGIGGSGADEIGASSSPAPHIGMITTADGRSEFIEVIPIPESKKKIKAALEGLSERLLSASAIVGRKEERGEEEG